MSSELALCCFLIFIAWLFFREKRSRPTLSGALWLPLAWAFIIGSQPISEWFGVGPPIGSAVDYLEGSPLDRAILFSLIALGMAVLFHRRERWTEIVQRNRWVLVFYCFLAVSALWSDYPFVSFKRWVKDFGNVVMALVILSEDEPEAAVKSVLLRSAYLLVPLSVMAVKYFPEIGRYYDSWAHRAHYAGVAGDKNLLGMALFVSALALFHAFLDARRRVSGWSAHIEQGVVALLMAMTAWLLVKADSVTAILCTALGAGMLFALDRLGTRKVAMLAAVFAIFAIMAFSVMDVGGVLGRALGRDATLTGRTAIWSALLDVNTNPLVGVGFYSFWLGERVETLSRKYHYTLNEAHNGYLECYLNSGLIGLALLFGLLSASIRAHWRRLQEGNSLAALGVAFLLGTVAYNISEATFNRLSIIWFTVLVMAMLYRRSTNEARDEEMPQRESIKTMGTPAGR